MTAVFFRKYNTLTVTGTTAIRIPMVKRGSIDFAVGADWTPATGDVKIQVDGTAAANVTNLPTAVTSGNTAMWEFILTAAELSCKKAVITIADSATKAVEDQSFIVETFGNASAMYPADLSDGVRLGLTGIPNATAGASGGLLINGSNTGNITFTGTLTITDGFLVNRSTANSSAVVFTGSGTGNGLYVLSGTGATGNGIHAVSQATNGSGLYLGGAGTKHGMDINAGATGNGILVNGGATSGHAIWLKTTSGDALNCQPTAGHGISATGNGTNKHGLICTGGTAGVCDGINAVAGTGGVDFRAHQTGNLTGTVATVTTLTNLPAITANWLTSTGIVAGALNGKGDWNTTTPPTAAAIVTALLTDLLSSTDFNTVGSFGKLLKDNIDATVSSRLASGSYTAPTTPPTTAAIVTALLTDLLSSTDFNTAGSFGKLLKDNIDAAISSRQASGATVQLDGSQPNYAPAKAGDAMTLTSGERTAIANEVEAQIIDDTDAERLLKAITDKIAAVNPDLSGLTLSAIATAVRTELATELDHLDADVSSRLASGDYIVPPTSAETVTALLTNLLSSTDFNTVGSFGKMLKDNIDAAISSRLASDDYTAPTTPPTAAEIVTALLTDLLSSTDFDTSGSFGKLIKDHLDASVSSRLADLDGIMIDGLTLPQAIMVIGAMAAGKLRDARTGSEKFKGLDGTTDRVTANVDPSGNRTSMTYHLP